ncbi:hypothetical protein IPJ72_03430 [Candidatus Peregrinibacteria bacterium]|nr:MAG: hypothetical protein IPJ72_03430 [Candidatus Peregrinibacteria bacterium]
MNKKFLAFAAIAIINLSACSTQSARWTGFYYPEGAPTVGEAVFEAQDFDTKAECETWATEKSQGNELAEHYCGYQCKYDSTGQYACGDETSA